MNVNEFIRKINLVYGVIGEELQEEPFQAIDFRGMGDLLSYLERDGKILNEQRQSNQQMMILRLKIGWEKECVELLGKLN